MELKQVRRIDTHNISAVHWNKVDKNEILEWFSTNGIMFTYHEIKSGGELIVYAYGNTHPVMVQEGFWILKTGKNNVQVVTNELFQEEYKDAE